MQIEGTTGAAYFDDEQFLEGQSELSPALGSSHYRKRQAALSEAAWLFLQLSFYYQSKPPLAGVVRTEGQYEREEAVKHKERAMKIAIVIKGAGEGRAVQSSNTAFIGNPTTNCPTFCGKSSREHAAQILEYYLLRAIDAAHGSTLLGA